MVGVGRDVDRLAFQLLAAGLDPDHDVVRRTLGVTGAVEEAVGAELLDHGHPHREPAIFGGHDPPDVSLAVPKDLRERRL